MPALLVAANGLPLSDYKVRKVALEYLAGVSRKATDMESLVQNEEGICLAAPASHMPSASSGNLQVQCVAYELPLNSATRTAEYLDCAVGHAKANGLLRSARLVFGDCSSQPIFRAEVVTAWKANFPHLTDITVTYFDQNLGHGGGQNRLLDGSTADLTLILNPDVVVAPNLLVEMLTSLRRPNVGLVEARQMPSEHPKDFDPATGRTSWCSGACLLTTTKLLRDVGGFDADTFFLYCDDVDLSWRVRLAGRVAVYQPTAVCFHDKRLSNEARWMAGAAERYYSAEAALLLAYKYSRPDLTERYLKDFRKSNDADLQKAAAAFDERKATGRLPVPLDLDHTVAQFIDGAYAKHRFQAR